MRTRTLTDTVCWSDGSPAEGVAILFRLVELEAGVTVTDTEVVLPKEISATTDATGLYTAELWTNEDGSLPTVWEVVLPTHTSRFVLAYGDGTPTSLTDILVATRALANSNRALFALLDERYAAIGSVGSGGSGVSDHGALTGLADDDHLQYLTTTRGDARYYSKSQIDTSLSGKANVVHNHDTLYSPLSHTHTGVYSPVAHNHDGVYQPVGSYAAAVHNHDTAYYPKSETYNRTEVDALVAVGGSGGGAALSDSNPAALGTAAPGTSGLASRADHVHPTPTASAVGAYSTAQTDSLLAGKSDTTHNHNATYYTKTEIDTALAGKASTTHNHDTSYYTKAQIDTSLAGKSDTTHTHTGVYSPVGHNHDSAYSAIGHNHDSAYAPLSHNHDTVYYTKTQVDTALAGKSDTSHTHDSRYYTETEVDTFLAGKASSTHNHDSSYYTKTQTYTKTETDAAIAAAAGGSSYTPPAARPKFGTAIHRQLYLPQNFGTKDYTQAQFYGGGIELFPVWLPRGATLAEIGLHVQIAAPGGTTGYLEYYEADSNWQISGSAKLTGAIDLTTTGNKAVTGSANVAAGAGWIALGHSDSVECMGWAINSAWVRNDMQNDRFIVRAVKSYGAAGTVGTIADANLSYSYSPVWAMAPTLLISAWV